MDSDRFKKDIIRAERLAKIDHKKWTNEDALFMKKYFKEIEEMMRLQKGLPHLYEFKHYSWSRQIFESTNREIFLTSANQIGKSCLAARKNIHLATETSLWPKFWPNLKGRRYPSLFFYFMPTLGLCTTEFDSKWAPFYLPQGDFKNDKKYGWKVEFFKGEVHSINFNSGVQMQFRSYTQKLTDIQASTVYHITCDEECPVEYLPEISARLNESEGLLLHIFTATRGQDYWRRTMQPSSKEEELHKDALKVQVSLYDSQFFEDGTPSGWTDAKIKRAIQNCPTQAEIDRRIFGKFVKAHGLMLESFSLEHNTCEPHIIPDDWLWYGAIDPGSGGQSGHPTGIAFIAVNPNYKEGRVVKCWRGDGIPTDNSASLNKFREIRGKRVMVQQIYDYAAKDFFTTASKVGETFIKADKSRDLGFGTLNTLFKNRMLKVFRGDVENEKLIQEILALPIEIDKRHAKDDIIDAVRYDCSAIPWDFSDIELFDPDPEKKIKPKEKPKTSGEERRAWFKTGYQSAESQDDISAELDYWGSLGED